MNTKFLFSISMFLIGSYQLYAQNSMGIGTETPNSNAVLELVSPGNNQGFLVPRLSTAQRTDAIFTDNLSESENGLLVFDTDENQFYFWVGNTWNAVGNQQMLADNDSTNELQTLTLNGSILNTTKEDAPIDLTALLEQNDNQALTFDNQTNVVTLDNGGQIDLSSLAVDNIDDADADPNNELQDLNFESNILTITGLTTPTEINLAPFAGTNTDEQVLSLAGTDLTISGGNTIDISSIDTDTQLSDAEIAALGYVKTSADGDASATNEIQDLQFSGNVISLTNDPGNTTIDLSAFDMDGSDDFSGSWNDLANIPADIADGDQNTQLSDADISAFGFIKSANLTGLQTEIDNTQVGSGLNTDGSYLANAGSNYINAATSLLDADNLLDTQVGINTTDIASNAIDIAANTTAIAADGDTDATNEYQDLSIDAENILSLSNSAATVDLGVFMDDTDAQTLSFDGTNLAITGGNSIDISALDTDTQLSDADIAAFGYVKTSIDGDASSTNELQTISKSGSNVVLSNSGGSASTRNARSETLNIDSRNFTIYEDETANGGYTVGYGPTTARDGLLIPFAQLNVSTGPAMMVIPVALPQGAETIGITIVYDNPTALTTTIELVRYSTSRDGIASQAVETVASADASRSGLNEVIFGDRLTIDNRASIYYIKVTCSSLEAGPFFRIYSPQIEFNVTY